jgi:hypothetical protein
METQFLSEGGNKPDMISYSKKGFEDLRGVLISLTPVT